MTFIFLDNLKSKPDRKTVLASEDLGRRNQASEGINVELPGKATVIEQFLLEKKSFIS